MGSSRVGPALLTLAALTIGTVLLGSAGSARAAADQSAECGGCHEEIAASFADTPHGRAFRFGTGGGDCTSCHGPGERHAAEGEVPGDLVIPGKSGTEQVNAQCSKCHGDDPQHGYWEGSRHERAGLSCSDCHSGHGSYPTLKGNRIESEVGLCVTCHGSQRKALAQRSHHPLREGKMQCSSCHNPHGSGTPRDLKADSVNDQCYSCHQEKRGPFLWEHSPVRENCLTCHNAHGSNHQGLLVTRTAQLCQSCHMQGRHQTVAGTETAMWNVSRQCLNCHSLIHGSNHPSGPLFQR